MRSGFRGLTRRTMVASGLAACLPVGAWAQGGTWPSRAVRLVVQFPAGGNSDAVARLVGEALAARWKQPVVIENRAGAGGTIGASHVSRQAPDGYVLGLAALSTHSTAPSMYANLPYEPLRDFDFIAPLTFTPNALLVNPKLPIHNLNDLVAYAKANPGRLNYSSPGIGLSDHLMVELLLKELGIAALHVPYTGSAEARTAILSGDVQMTFGTASAAMPQIVSGQLRAIAVSGDKRLPMLPDVPTVLEQGMPSVVAYTWTGLCAPKGVPEAVLTKIQRDVTSVLAQPDIQQKIAATGSEIKPMSPAQFRDYVGTEIQRWGEVIRRSGIKAE